MSKEKDAKTFVGVGADDKKVLLLFVGFLLLIGVGFTGLWLYSKSVERTEESDRAQRQAKADALANVQRLLDSYPIEKVEALAKTSATGAGYIRGNAIMYRVGNGGRKFAMILPPDLQATSFKEIGTIIKLGEMMPVTNYPSKEYTRSVNVLDVTVPCYAGFKTFNNTGSTAEDKVNRWIVHLPRKPMLTKTPKASKEKADGK